MKLYLIERVELLTCNYHSEGSLLVSAEDESDIRAVVKENQSSFDWDGSNDKYPRPTDEEYAKALFIGKSAGGIGRRIWIFPDAGCC